MRQALISDIHGNLEALNAVLADISSQSIDEIICLGDVVGYGPNPIECLELVMKKAKLTIRHARDPLDPRGIGQGELQGGQ
jgi:predicted phosphodiesterase